MADLSKIVDELSSLTILEAAALVKMLEEKWGVSAAAPVAAPKVVADFAKANDKFVILGGGLGNQALSPDGVKALASLPSLDELRAKLAGIISQPATKLASVLSQPGGGLARVIKARAEKDQAA